MLRLVLSMDAWVQQIRHHLLMNAHRGQPKSVHSASARRPLAGHKQEFTPSPLGKATCGMHLSTNDCSLRLAQRKLLHLESCLKPLAAQTQVLQPSPAENRTPGQHSSSAFGIWGGVEHLRLVQRASTFEPLLGHVQVFSPSPAGYAIPGVHLSTDCLELDGQRILVHRA